MYIFGVQKVIDGAVGFVLFVGSGLVYVILGGIDGYFFAFGENQELLESSLTS